MSPVWHLLSPKYGMIRQTTLTESIRGKEGEGDWLLVLQLQLQFPLELLHVLHRVLGASCRTQAGFPITLFLFVPPPPVATSTHLSPSLPLVEIKDPSFENPELTKVLPSKPGVGEDTATQASSIARNFFLANIYPLGPFKYICSKSSFRCFLAVTWVPEWAGSLK